MADKKVIRTIGVLTSGGDAPGMNAAIRAVVRTALGKGLKVRGIRRGYQGLLNEEIIDLSARDVSDTIERGGTILQTARCAEMRTEEGQQKAAAICKKYGIDGLVVIGGDGSFAGAQKLANFGINTIGLPGTIDLDIACTEYTIGFDTAVNTAMQAIDKVRDTSTSHERCSIIEVMGRDAGYLALWCGIANGAEKILMPEEHDYDEDKIIADIQESRKRGKKNYIIINAEGVGDSINMAKRIEEATGMETRATILGHMQREDEIRKFLSDLREKNDYAYVLLLVTDIFEEGSMFIVEGLHGHVDRVFGIDSSKSVWVPGILSRKKQVAAPLLEL